MRTYGIFRFFLFCLVFFFFCGLAGAASLRSLGPFGGDVRSLAQDSQHPQKLYLGTLGSQIYSSSDGGRSWERLSALASRSDLVVDHILVDPADPNRLYAGAWSVTSNTEGGVYVSTDAGRTWSESQTIHGQSVRALAMAPSNTKVLVAGTLEGVFRSTDAGQTWKQISPPQHAEIRNIQSAAIDPRNPDIIYVGTWHLAWKTTDGGKTWVHIQRGIVEDSDVFALFIDRSSPDHLLLSACTGIYETSSAGDHWTKFKGIPSSSRRTRAIVAKPNNPEVIYAGTTEGLWKTANGGATWNLLTPRTLTVNAIVIDVLDASRILLGTDDAGVLVSTNGGQQFSPMNKGFSSRTISSLLFDRQQSGRIFLSVLNDHDQGGVFLTEDGAATWRQANEGLRSTDVQVLFQSNADGSIWAGTSDAAYVWNETGHCWKRMDSIAGSETLTSSLTARPTAHSRAAASGKVTSTTVKGLGSVMSFSGESSYGHYFFAATERGLFVTRDSGASWKHISTPDASLTGTAVLAFSDGRIFYGTSRGLSVSLDEGLHWKTVTFEDSPTPIHKIVSNPDDSKILLLATGRGLYRSNDGGNSWSLSGGGVPKSDILDIQFNSHSPHDIYLTESYYGIPYRSADLGETWEWLQPSVERGLRYKSIQPDPLSPPRFFAVSMHEGLFVFALPNPQKEENLR